MSIRRAIGHHDRWNDVAAYTCSPVSSDPKLMNRAAFNCNCPDDVTPDRHGPLGMRHKRHHKKCAMNLSAPLREDFDFAHPELLDYNPVNSFNRVYTPAGNIVRLK